MNGESEQPEILLKAHDLIMSLIEGRIAAGEMRTLGTLMREDARVREMYIMYQAQRCILAALAGPAVPQLLSTDSMHEAQVMEAISRESAEADKDVVRPLVRPLVLPTRRPNEGRMAIGKRGLTAAAAAFIAVAGLIFFLSRPNRTNMAQGPVQPSPPALVTLTRVIDATWSNGTPTTGESFDSVTHLSLSGGYAEFTFASGADMVVQAPAEIVIQSNNSVTLQSGKLAATVPPAAVGFSVIAGQSVITDLGTEFGVNENASGTEVEVFKGKVTAQTPSTRPVLLVANDAAKIDAGGKLKVDSGGAVPQRFVRQLKTEAKSLDLVDLTAGGDGTTARRGEAIDATTGKWGPLAPVGDEMGTLGYQRVPLAVIDGCFVPGLRMTQIDSRGDKFSFRGSTGVAFNHIMAGNKNNWPDKWGSPLSVVLGGIDYNKLPHGFLFLHANSGLTFDLAAIAALYPGNQITGLHSVVGNPIPDKALGNAASGAKLSHVECDVYVFVDGTVRFHQLVTNKAAPIVVDLPLQSTDRYLTLATSRNGYDISGDWMMFGDPGIELSTAK